MSFLNVNTVPKSGKERTISRRERLSSSRVRLTIKDIYCGVEWKLDEFDYRYDSTDVEEFVASVLDMYLDSAERGFGRAAVDMRAAHEVFLELMEARDAKRVSRTHSQCMVQFILAELNDYIETLEIMRVYNYTIYGTQLVIDCLRRIRVKAVA